VVVVTLPSTWEYDAWQVPLPPGGWNVVVAP
jgi:hypothetical protein